jgi:hypothetical protein
MARYKKTAKRYSEKSTNYRGKSSKGKKAAARKYATAKKGITKKFSAKVKPVVKTMDSEFTGVYNAGTYTPDTLPRQQMPFNTSGAMQALNLIVQGSGSAQRIGVKCAMKSLRLRFTFNTTGKNCLTQQYGRIIVLYDRQPVGAYFNINTLFADNIENNNVNNGNPVTSMLNVNEFERCVTLHDEIFPLVPFNAGAVTGTGLTSTVTPCSFMFDKYINLKGLEVVFASSQTPQIIANVETGALYVIVWGTATVNSTDAWQVYGNARLRFRDC